MKQRGSQTRKTIKAIMKKSAVDYKQMPYAQCINEIVNILKAEDNILLNDFIKIKIRKVKPRKFISHLRGTQKEIYLSRTEKIFIHPTETFKSLIFQNRKPK